MIRRQPVLSCQMIKMGQALVAAAVCLATILTWVVASNPTYLPPQKWLGRPESAVPSDGAAALVAAANEPSDTDLREGHRIVLEDSAQHPQIEAISMLALNEQLGLAGSHHGQLRDSGTIHDWGEAPADTDLEYTFVLHNDGDAPLKIIQARPASSCSAVILDRDIPPRGEGKIKVQVNGNAMRVGRVVRMIDVITNGHLADTSLILTGNVVATTDRR
ncbi:hypothetical protein LBMAG49_08210 [Planctomycetota bacterium]|nr:hypothetical protein LBMAG49_08210 [Planctomycetota bacterium]